MPGSTGRFAKRYEAEEARNFQERMAPLILQQQANQANQYYQYSTANALQNIGNAAAQNALSNRGPGSSGSTDQAICPRSKHLGSSHRPKSFSNRLGVDHTGNVFHNTTQFNNINLLFHETKSSL